MIYCKYCGSKIPTELSSRKYCNKDCSRLFWNKKAREKYKDGINKINILVKLNQ